MKIQSALKAQAIDLLKSMITTPSLSGKEEGTALLIEGWFRRHDIVYERSNNNVWARNKNFDPSKPTLLLNSHHDTVKPNTAYTRDPFHPEITADGRLFGLGSNDAGGSLVSLLAVFTNFYTAEKLLYNLVFVGSAEEETSGSKGLNSVLPLLPPITVAIVGEPTLMNLAIAEKGLLVLDAEVYGTPSHAAHPNDDNALYKCIDVLKWFKEYRFEKVSDLLGPVKLTVTQIEGGSQHNVVPEIVKLVIDVRVNDCYSNKEVLDLLSANAPCDLKARSLRLNSSSITPDHTLVKAGIALGRKTYGSPTLSDQSVLSCPSLKLGPGDSRRSHTADEFIYISEIEEAIDIYKDILVAVIF